MEDHDFSTAGVVLAAGLSRRMGRPKQLIEIEGRVMLAHTLDAVMQSKLAPVILVLGYMALEIQEALQNLYQPSDRLTVVYNPEYTLGQSTSVKTGLGHVPPQIDSVMFIPGDTIGLQGTIIDEIIVHAGSNRKYGVVRPLYGGKTGPPVLWKRQHFPALARIKGDTGGRQLLKRIPKHDVGSLNYPPEQAPFDIDTEEDLQAWLSRQQGISSDTSKLV